jgi:hypothetical protein
LARKRAEEEAARQKAAAEALAKKQAEEEAALQKAAEEAARQRATPDGPALKAAEAGEQALRLTQVERQRIQVALTSLGFDTRGNDGVFGPRSREMIANWQKNTGATGTGFVSAAQRDNILRVAAVAVHRWDEEQKKIDDDKARLEEEKAKPDASKQTEPPTAAASSPGQAPLPPAGAPAPGAAALNGHYSGGFNLPVGMCLVSLNVMNGSGQGIGAQRGTKDPVELPLSVQISPGGDVTGSWRVCGRRMDVRGRADARAISLNLTGFSSPVTLTLTRSASGPSPLPAASAPITPPTADTAAAASPAAAVGTYSGTVNWSGGRWYTGPCLITLTMANGRGTGTARFIGSKDQSGYHIAIEVSSTGVVSGNWRIGDDTVSVRGRADDKSIQLELAGFGLPVSVRLPRRES